ncbi:RRP6-like protein 3 isoform X2 [Tanacetum coccineum]
MLEYARMDAHYLLYVAELKLLKNELEASPGQSAASSIIYRHLNDPESSSDNSQAWMHDESLKYVLSDNAIVALAKKIPVTEADISTTISQADTHLGFLNSNSTTASPSSVVISHLVDFRFLLQGELQNPDEILQLYIKKHLGTNGSCPLSLYNYGLLSKSNIKVPKRLVSEENGDKFSKKRELAKLVDEDPPAIMLHFEHKSKTNFENKKNICVGCGEGNNYLRHHIIPSSNSFAEEYKKKVASDYGIPLFVHEVVNFSVSPLKLGKIAKIARTYYGGREISDEDLKKALLVGPGECGIKRMRTEKHLYRNSSSKNTVLDTALNSDIEDGADASKNEINELEKGSMLDSDINTDPTDASAKQHVSVNIISVAVIATCSSKLLLRGHGPHGKQVVDYLLKEHEDDGIQEFCQRWRQVFVEVINPWFLPAGWREFGDLSIYNPANKGSPSVAKDLTV